MHTYLRICGWNFGAAQKQVKKKWRGEKSYESLHNCNRHVKWKKPKSALSLLALPVSMSLMTASKNPQKICRIRNNLMRGLLALAVFIIFFHAAQLAVEESEVDIQRMLPRTFFSHRTEYARFIYYVWDILDKGVWCATDGIGNRSSRQHTATHCNTLQHTATHCNNNRWNRQ